MISVRNRASETIIILLCGTVFVQGNEGTCYIKPDGDGHVTIPDGDVIIAEEAFLWCRGLLSVNISASVKDIEDRAFFNTNVTDVTFEEGSTLESIGQDAFGYTYELNSISFPASLKNISYAAFVSSGLESINFEAGSKLESIGSFAFASTYLDSANIPANAVIEEFAFRNNGCTDDSLFIAGRTICNCTVEEADSCSPISAQCYITPDSNGHVIIPDGEESIDKNAFIYCSALKSVFIPASIEIIAEGAFFSTNLTEITFEECSSLKDIGDKAFGNNYKLRSANVPANVTIGNSVFYQNGCDSATIFTEGVVIENCVPCTCPLRHSKKSKKSKKSKNSKKGIVGRKKMNAECICAPSGCNKSIKSKKGIKGRKKVEP